jgi:hypothetical protein
MQWKGGKGTRRKEKGEKEKKGKERKGKRKKEKKGGMNVSMGANKNASANGSGEREAIEEYIEWRTLISNGLKNINGAYARVTKLSIRRNDERKVFVASGAIEYGVQDTGDGHSETFKDRFEGAEIPFEVVKGWRRQTRT